MIKKEIRVLGIDDSPFDKFRDKSVLVVASLFRGGNYLDGVLSTYVAVDGTDSTIKLTRLISSSKWRPQLQAILLDGIAFAGFNILDIGRLNRSTAIPVIVVMRTYPDLPKIHMTLRKIGQEKKIQLLEKAGEIHRIGGLFCQLKGISPVKAKEILDVTITHSNIPEALRVSHLIASGIVRGESKGRA